MNDLLTKANIMIRKDRPLDDPNKIITTFRRNDFLQLTFQTDGCRYSASGSCSMCNYGKGKKINIQDILKELETICQSKDFYDCSMVLLGASGSFLDDYEIPEEYQFKIMERIAKSNMSEIFIETHYKSITIEKLHKIRNLFGDKCIYIEMGLETITEEFQFNILNKVIKLNELDKIIKQIHAENMLVSLNVLLGMPFLNKNEQIADTLKSIRWALDKKVDYVVVFPINIQPYTLFEWWYANDFLSVVSPWLLVELLLELTDDELKNVCLAWYGNRCIAYSDEKKTQIPYACPLCQPYLVDFFEKFSGNFDLEYRKKILKNLCNTKFSCNCREDFNKQSESIESPREIAYEALERLVNDYAINGSN